MFKILVVEDDSELNRTVCSFLNQGGYETTGSLEANDANYLSDNLIKTIHKVISMDITGADTDTLAEKIEAAKKKRPLEAPPRVTPRQSSFFPHPSGPLVYDLHIGF